MPFHVHTNLTADELESALNTEDRDFVWLAFLPPTGMYTLIMESKKAETQPESEIIKERLLKTRRKPQEDHRPIGDADAPAIPKKAVVRPLRPDSAQMNGDDEWEF